MKQEILLIPTMKDEKYIGTLDVEFKAGNNTTNDWEVIRVPLLDGVKLAIFNRDIVSILVNGIDIEFQWNQETRSILADYRNLSFLELFNTIYNNKLVIEEK
jgi:hypothetical protein